MVSKQNGRGNGRGAFAVAVKSHANPTHSHIDSIARAFGGPAVLNYGLNHIPSSVPGFLSTGGFLAVAALAVGVVIVGGLILNELTHLGKL